MSQDIATNNLLQLVAKDKNITNKLLSIKGLTRTRDEYDISADVQETLYDYYSYWTTYRATKLVALLEHANYLNLIRELEISRLNGEV